jgi:phosphoserine phosphatase
MRTRTTWAAVLLAAATLLGWLAAAPAPAPEAGQPDPLAAWKDGPAKKAIREFVAAVTAKGGADYVSPEDRIATFDNDGTLWCEQPTVEVAFSLERFKELLPKHPEWKDRQPFKAILEKDRSHFAHLDVEELLGFYLATHGDVTKDEFQEVSAKFLATAKHPKFGVLYKQLTYQPMVELVRYLQAHGFRVYICSGGDVDFMRTVSQEIYGIPSENVIGTSVVYEAREVDDKLVLYRTAKLRSFNDKLNKPVNIWLRIGKRPILSAGNVRSGGDIAMLRYCQGTKGRTLQLMVNHDDDVREFAYAEKDGESLAAARKYGWQVVSMKNDWQRVFAFEK